MDAITITNTADHANILLDDEAIGRAVQANQHLIIDHNEGVLLDPGGAKAFRRVYPATLQALGTKQLRHIFFSHQDPDIIAAANGWLTATNAEAHISALWLRFVPHFGLDSATSESLSPIPDEGMVLPVGETELAILPAHFLHSSGNHQVYDPVTKVLYTGDLGASLGQPYREVTDFDAHLAYMTGFHQRYLASGKACKMWAAMVRKLDIEIIAPQHGALFRGKALANRFIDWVDGLQCGVDIMAPFDLPPGFKA